MWEAIRKYFTISSYLHRWKKMRRRWKVSRLKKRKMLGAEFAPVWEVKLEFDRRFHSGEVCIGAFGVAADSKINWMKDVPANHEFPPIRMDKLKMSIYYDKGIDVKYPWELSRFIFGNELAARYALSGEKENYSRFREMALDWIDSNPFLMGVNWICTMDVAIRATNWILAANAFSTEIKQDSEFIRLFSKSLEEHGNFIHAFPEVYSQNHTTNHTTADYVGLLYVARALPFHPDSAKWQKKAVQGLIKCIEYQVYPDGGSFEASAGYHRLVTELFGLAAMLCQKHSILLPEAYYLKLHAMFLFLFSICDMHGNSPLFGDNDSGTLLQFDFEQNHNYSYMKEFYYCLFSHGTDQQKSGHRPDFLALMPRDCKKYTVKLRATGLKSKESRLFGASGILAFRNNNLTGNVHFIPIGQRGHGGHNHLDVGSFNLSYQGKPVVVDPGTYTYTRDVQLRNRFRAYSSHNVVIPINIKDEDFNRDKLFELDPYCKTLDFSLENAQRFSLSFKLLNHPHAITRRFQVEEESFILTNTTQDSFSMKFHFAPGVEIINTMPGQVQTNIFTLNISPKGKFQVEQYDFAEKYSTRERAFLLTINAESNSTVIFDFKNGN